MVKPKQEKYINNDVIYIKKPKPKPKLKKDKKSTGVIIKKSLSTK